MYTKFSEPVFKTYGVYCYHSSVKAHLNTKILKFLKALQKWISCSILQSRIVQSSYFFLTFHYSYTSPCLCPSLCKSEKGKEITKCGGRFGRKRRSSEMWFWSAVTASSHGRDEFHFTSLRMTTSAIRNTALYSLSFFFGGGLLYFSLQTSYMKHMKHQPSDINTLIVQPDFISYVVSQILAYLDSGIISIYFVMGAQYMYLYRKMWI
jgi:hypothetical protein